MNESLFGFCLFVPSGVNVTKLIEQRLRLFKIARIEAFGEPTVDFRKHCARLVTAAGIAKESSESCGRPQLQRFCLLFVRDSDPFAEIQFSLFLQGRTRD